MGWTDYREQSTLWLDMKMRDHDPVNVRTLDRSGNGHHATFGDGSTSTTYPTKLSKKGYSFDGGDYFIVDDSSDLDFSSSGATLFWQGKIPAPSAVKVLIGKGNGLQVCDFTMGAFRGGVILYRGLDSLSSISYADSVNPDQVATYIISIPAGAISYATGIHLFVNGRLVEGTGGTAALGYTASRNLGLCSYNTGGNAVDDGTECYSAGIFPFALTDLQAKDLHTRLMREINEV